MSIEAKVDDVNVIELKDLNLSLLAIEDKIIVLIDGWKSGYECKTCEGSGKVPSTLVPGAFKDCPDCKGKGAILHIPDNAKRLPATGRIVSMGPKCNAEELKTHIADAKRKLEKQKEKEFDPNIDYWTEFIKDREEELKKEYMRVGARIVFSPHVGTFLPLKGNVLIKIMRVHEPLCIVFGNTFDEKKFIDFETSVV